MSGAAKTELFKLRLSEAELAEWRAEAERDGLSLSAWVRRCVEEAIAVERATRRTDELLAGRAERMHRLVPTEARRRDWGRAGEQRGGS